jgi:hypothetical protein
VQYGEMTMKEVRDYLKLKGAMMEQEGEEGTKMKISLQEGVVD